MCLVALGVGHVMQYGPWPGGGGDRGIALTAAGFVMRTGPARPVDARDLPSFPDANGALPATRVSLSVPEAGPRLLRARKR